MDTLLLIEILGSCVIVLAVLTVILLILVIVNMSRTKKLSRKYEQFMRGKNAASMEQNFLELFDDVDDLKDENRAIREKLSNVNFSITNSIQKIGVVRYDAFKGMGGHFSFAVALLDRNNTGVILNSVHSTETCYMYLKEVNRGKSDSVLSVEEQKSLEKALSVKVAEPPAARPQKSTEAKTEKSAAAKTEKSAAAAPRKSAGTGEKKKETTVKGTATAEPKKTEKPKAKAKTESTAAKAENTAKKREKREEDEDD